MFSCHGASQKTAVVEDQVIFGVPPRVRAGVEVQSLGGTGPIRAGHVPCPDMPSNLIRVGPLADRPAPPATWPADGNLRLAVMRAVRRRVIGASRPDSLPIRWSHQGPPDGPIRPLNVPNRRQPHHPLHHHLTEASFSPYYWEEFES